MLYVKEMPAMLPRKSISFCFAIGSELRGGEKTQPLAALRYVNLPVSSERKITRKEKEWTS